MTQDTQVRVREDAALESPFARPDDVGGEVFVAPPGELGRDLGIHLGALAGEDEQLLRVVTLGFVELAATASGAWICARCVAKAQYLQ